MKNFSLILIILFSLRGFSQNPELINTTWYLHHVEIDTIEIVPPVNIDITHVEANFSQNNLVTEICSTSNAVVSNYTNNSFQVDEFVFVGFDCSLQETIDFDTLYFFEFFEIDISNTVFSYQILDGENNSRELTLVNQHGNKAVYRNITLSTIDQISSPSFSLFPNPATNTITISLQNADDGELTIYNSLGKKVFDSSFKDKQEIDINFVKTGLYFATIITQQGLKETLKFIKK